MPQKADLPPPPEPIQQMPVVPTNGYKSPQVGCDSNCGHYWCGVGQVATGYFINAPYNAVMGTVEAAMDPIGTLQELGHAVMHPIQTTKAIINDAYDKAQTLEGQGELIGNFAFNRLNLGGRLTSKVTTSVTQAVNKLDTHFNAAPAGNVVKRADDTAHIKDIKIDSTKYPESAKHLKDSGYNGQLVTTDRNGIDQRRKDALSKVKSKPKLDRDEMPPAVFKEGSQSVRHISPSDNRGAGASIGNQLRGIPDGVKVRIVVDP